MDSTEKLFIDRAKNELVIAEKLKAMSDESGLRAHLEIPEGMTFYSAVISHSYYAIFYSAKAALLSRGITTSAPEIHKNTVDAFKEHLVDTGVLDVKLFEIYKRLVVRADALLDIFRGEKRKRGDFTYNTLPQANREPAEDSLANATFFVANIRKTMMAGKR